jgi:galactokinase
MDLAGIKKIFIEKYGKLNDTIHTYFAPGRVNLIGEHTDYNGGFVLPCALSFGTYLLIRKNTKNVIRFSSTNFYYSADIQIKDLAVKDDDNWVNYPLGVLNILIGRGFEPVGLDLLYMGNIPIGAGLSSSASIELVTAYAINDIFSLKLSKIELALIGQKAENDFVGMNCGIMDQFAVAMGESDSALFLKCQTMKYEIVPVKMEGLNIVISNTNKQRKLTDSKYNERRNECQKALNTINSFGVLFNSLSDIDLQEFHTLQKLIGEENIRRRAKHVITENARVVNAASALRKSNFVRFGQLMYESHNSLRDDYEVSCLELDTLVEESIKCDGVIGSRMTGGGFGGCTVSIIKENSIEDFKEKVGRNYFLKTKLKADFYTAKIGDGVQKIQ